MARIQSHGMRNAPHLDWVMSYPQVTGLILAGGNSTRMGTDKALLVWQGATLLERVFAVADRCCGRVAVVSPWPERYAGILPQTVNWILESPAHGGPLVALAQGLEAVQTPWVLLLACDMPTLDHSVIQGWIRGLPDSPSPALAYVPYYQSRWEPLCGLYHADGRSSLTAFMAQGGRSLQHWLTDIAAVPLRVDAAIAPMLRNCNRPEDLGEG